LSERDQMSERRENSVLVALRELRGLEDDRVKREQEEALARAEVERAAKEATERRARDEDETRRLAEEDRVRRAEEEKQARIREEQLRIEDAERRARVDGEVRLQEERMRLEIQSRADGKSPVKAVLAVAAVLALVGGGIVYKIQAAHKEEIAIKDREAKEAKEQQELKHRAEQAEFDKKLSAIMHEMDDKLKTAKSDAERAQIRAEAARKEALVEDRSGKTRKRGSGPGSGSDQAGKPAAGLHVPGKREISNGILDGL
jgi:dTMP kinase